MFGRKFFVFLLLAAFDYAVVFFSISSAFFIRYLVENGFSVTTSIYILSEKTWFFTVFAAFFVFLFYLRGLYRKRIGFWDETKEVTRTAFAAIVIFFFATAIFKLEHSMSRAALLFGIFLIALFVPVVKLLLKKRLYEAHIWGEKAIIIGENRKATELAEKFEADSYLGYKIVGFAQNIDGHKEFANQKIDTVVVCGAVTEKELITLQKVAKNIILSPDIQGVAVLNTEFNYSFDERTFFLTIKNNLKSETNIFIKRTLDVALSVLAIPLILPLIAVISILIRFDSKGLAIFKQKRLGEGGKEFWVYKFRSMYQNADEILANHLAENSEANLEWSVYKKIKGNDPRITKIGRFLRAMSIDELPQIFNVLKGEMSIVGPRPYLLIESEDMGDKREYILEAKPGITGLWQVSGRNELTFEERLSMDVWYTLNWSVWLDIVILLKTIKVVIKKSGAY
ncbi:MAG TPA: undecaprenyl-phosphate galactose phosphotransferase WbaP [Campylobacterales bacterium]|nr:undecaprenyl-phosphate galactose phosphotransferase WbaP [Campylobacterales bacterium]